MPYIDLKRLNELRELGFVRTNVKDGLMVATYKELARFEPGFSFDDPVLRGCRGVVFEEATGLIVGHCMPKFFNVGEKPETQYIHLPIGLPYEVTNKEDGSMLTSFVYKGKLYHTTKGSFNNIYIDHAYGYLPELEDNGMTLVSEIRIPDDVEQMARVTRRPEGLYLITAFFVDGTEASRELCQDLATALNLGIVDKVDMTLEELEANHYSLKGTEGWVVKFSSGLRVKFKTAWYMSLNRILDEIDTPERARSYVKDMLTTHKDGDHFTLDWIETIPDEYKEAIRLVASDVIYKFRSASLSIALFVGGHRHLPRKDFALSVKDFDYPWCYFHAYDSKPYGELLWKNI